MTTFYQMNKNNDPKVDVSLSCRKFNEQKSINFFNNRCSVLRTHFWFHFTHMLASNWNINIVWILEMMVMAQGGNFWNLLVIPSFVVNIEIADFGPAFSLDEK
jgi:hypothetical protein